MKTILLKFEGYWLDRYKAEIPHGAGVYCVYTCEPIAEGRIVVLRELVYVGSAGDVAACLTSHPCLDEWKARLQSGEMLCYSFAPAVLDVAVVAERALISHHTPTCNQVVLDMATSPSDTKIVLEGEHIFLDDSVTA